MRMTGTLDDVGDDSGFKHGTAVASIIAAPRNGWGVVGIWPAARIVSRRVFAQAGQTDLSGYVRAVNECIYDGVTVINVSLTDARGTLVQAQHLEDSLARAERLGISVVAAAGNSGGPVEFPANVPGVLAVAGSDINGALCATSAYGPGPDGGPRMPRSVAYGRWNRVVRRGLQLCCARRIGP